MDQKEKKRLWNRKYYEKKKNDSRDLAANQDLEDKKKLNQRFQYWTFIIYPESAPSDWRDKLDALIVPWACSPLHDKDIEKDENGSEVTKKAHRHIIIKTGKKSYNQMKVISDLVCGAPPVGVLDPQAMTRYLVHMDHPKKFQYDKKEIEFHSGYDAKDWLGLNTRQQLDLLRDMMEMCKDQCIDEFSDLYFWTMEHQPEWWEYISLHVYQVHTILWSWHSKLREERFGES